MNKSVYILDDDIELLEIYSMCFDKNEIDTFCFSTQSALIQQIDKKIPDLIILDIMLENSSGLDVLKTIRNDDRFKDIFVIFISAMSSELDKVNGLDLGADDYIVKPFKILELRSKVNAFLRRVKSTSNITKYHDIEIDRNKRVVKQLNNILHLTQKEYDLLCLFVDNQEIVLSREEILSKIWGYDFLGETRTIDMHIKSLRSKLACNVFIKTVRGVGYILTNEK